MNRVSRPTISGSLILSLLLLTIKGQVKYPGVYEVVPGETLAAALNMSGGTTFVGRSGAIQIFRQEDDGITVALSVDISRAGETELRNADVISVGSGRENRGKRYPSCFVSSGTKEICSSIYSCNREI